MHNGRLAQGEIVSGRGLLKVLPISRTVAYTLAAIVVVLIWWRGQTAVSAVITTSEAQIARQQSDMDHVIDLKIGTLSDPYLLTKLGASAVSGGRFEVGIKALQKAVSLDPKWRDGWWVLGHSWVAWSNDHSDLTAQTIDTQRSKRLGEAKTALEKCLQIDPQYQNAKDLLDRISQ